MELVGALQDVLGSSGPLCCTDSRRRAILVPCLGVKANDSFASLPSTGTLDEVIVALGDHFGSHLNTVSARFRFQQWQDRQGESIHEYVARLRQLARKCNFCHLQEELIQPSLLKRLTFWHFKRSY